MYHKVTVIGLGTLGGFLCKNISELDFVKEIIIVDPDIVEGKNVFKSIYKSSNIGEYKVDALAEIISDDVTVTKIRQEYIEGKTLLPKSNLVIDCRDVVCDRKAEIDVRFYISERVLIIDCRKNVRNKQCYDGAYSINLSKSEINKASFFAAQIIECGEIKNMIQNNLVQRVDLNLLSYEMSKSIEKSIRNKIDMIYDLSDNAQRLQCIEENVKPILTLNKKRDIEVFVGERTKVLEKRISESPDIAKTKHAVLQQNSLTKSLDVIQALERIINLQPEISNFIVTVRQKDGKEYVELLEETGAA
jgi:molybdopterin/thiamine biosynthesis adenylyltransferase